MRRRIKQFIKSETVLVVSCVLALMSMLAVAPDKEYVGYVNFRVLAILAGLMMVMAGLRNHGFFTSCARGLLSFTKGAKSSAFVLVFLCFFFSMVITNDVALITFVPLTIELLTLMNRRDLCIRVVALQTVAANLGSMATPIGNPQNLYLYDLMHVSFASFVKLMLIPTACSALMLILMISISTGGHKAPTAAAPVAPAQPKSNPPRKLSGKLLALYAFLFALNIMTVLDIVPYYVSIAVTIAAVYVADRQALKIDYALLATFVAFFIFIGNMGRIEFIADFLRQVVSGRELETGIILSQGISNVPAAILLSGFTNNYAMLLYGVSAGGLGTLIASMANLISYKYVAREGDGMSRRYIIEFTLLCLIFLVPLYMVMKIIPQL